MRIGVIIVAERDIPESRLDKTMLGTDEKPTSFLRVRFALPTGDLPFVRTFKFAFSCAASLKNPHVGACALEVDQWLDAAVYITHISMALVSN